MNILLDTHAIIWFFENDNRLSKNAVEIIYNLENMIYVSMVSIWEVAIKMSTGKLNFDGGIDNFIKSIYQNEFELLDISPKHTKIISTLSFIHRDPFDRMLIAQAIADDLIIMTVDENIIKYDIECVW